MLMHLKHVFRVKRIKRRAPSQLSLSEEVTPGFQFGTTVVSGDDRKNLTSFSPPHPRLQGLVSVALTKASENEGFIPVNKNLW